MSQKLERDLSVAHRDLVQRAKAARDANNFDYTINLLQTVLKAEPLFLEGRKILRRAEIKKYQSQSAFARQMSAMKVSASAMKLSSKKNPTEDLVQAEEILAHDPFNSRANLLMAEAGVALGLPELKVFAYETLAEEKPGDKAPLHQLARAYMEARLPANAEKVYNRILEIDPRDGEAISGRKNASAANASSSGGWEKAQDYREVLKNKDLSVQLEQEARVIKSEEAIDAEIQRVYQQHQAEPTNVLFPKKIGALCAQKDDCDSAVQWYEYAFSLSGGTDSAMQKIISDLRLRSMEKAVKLLRENLAEAPDEEAKSAYEAQLAAKIEELNQLRLSEAEARVQRQPNDGEFRFELGNALFQMGQYRKALQEFQQSLRATNVRHRALSLMGQSYLALNMNDLAVDTFASAASELVAMDELKKEIVYNLGLAYQAMEQPAKALEQFKKIYALDIAYRDVAERVERSY